MKVKIEIDTQTFIRFWLVVIGFGLAGLAIYTARTALLIVGTAIFLALILNPPVNYLAKYLPGKGRVAATAAAFVLVVLLIGTFLTLLVPPIVQQTAKFAQTVPSIVDGATNQYKGLSTVIEKYNLQPQVDEALTSLKSQSSNLAANFGQTVIGSVSSLVAFVTALILTLALSFLMLIEGPKLIKSIWRLYTDTAKRDHHMRVMRRMNNVVTSFVIGQITVSGIGAAVTGLFIFMLSFFLAIPANIAIPAAAIYFVLSLIPMFGATIGAVLIALLLVLNDATAALIYIVEFIVYQQIENNFISPTIQSKRLDLSALLILVSVTVGVYVFGIAGGIISIPIAGCIKVLFDEYQTTKSGKAPIEKPIVKLAKKVTSK